VERPERLNHHLIIMFSTTVGWQFAACSVVGLLYWIAVCISMRYALRVLLMYRGYMYEARGKKVSATTKVWGLLMKSGHEGKF